MMHSRAIYHPLQGYVCKRKTRSDHRSAFLMAVHNIGAGGTSEFCSTSELAVSEKRTMQRWNRRCRAIGRLEEL